MSNVTSCFPKNFDFFCDDFQAGFSEAYVKVSEKSCELCENLKVHAQEIGSCIYDNVLVPIAHNLKSGAEKTISYIKNHWEQLLAYIIAWGAIVVCTGLMYGFEAVALPLTIGIAGGLGFGILAGIITVKIFDKDYSLWNGISYILNRLDSGTRPIVISVAVTVLLATSVVFPYIAGAAFGIVLGNQLAVNAAFEDPNAPTPPPTPPRVEATTAEVETQLNQLREQMTDEVKELRTQLATLTEKLTALTEQLQPKTNDIT